MRPPCAPPTNLPPAIPRFRIGTHRPVGQDEVQMTITAPFRVDRHRLLPDLASKRLADSATKRVPHGRGDGRSHRPAIIAVPGNGRVATQGEKQTENAVFLRRNRCRAVLPKSSENPGNSREKVWYKKNISRERAPCGPKSREKRRFTRFQTGPGCTDLGSERSQMGAKIARWFGSLAARSEWPIGCQSGTPTLEQPALSRAIGANLEDNESDPDLE